MEKKKIKTWEIVVISIAAALLAALVIGYLGIRSLMSNMRKDLVEVVSAPVSEASASPTETAAPPTPDPFEQALSTDKDYYESGEIQKIPIYEQSKIDRFITSILVIVKNGSIHDETNQTDMIFIISWNALQQKFTVVAIPRDTLVLLDEYGWKRINMAYTYGDRGMLINTINETFGLDIQDYVLIGTEELANLANGVNGIPVTLTEAEATYLNEQLGCSLSAGENKLSGEQIILYLLDRTSDNKGAIGRVECQLTVIHDTFDYLTESFDRDFLYPFLHTITNGILTNMDFETLFGLGHELIMSDDLKFITIRLPYDDSYSEIMYDGGYAILPAFEKNKILLQQALYGKE